MMDTPKTDSQTEELKAITRQLELLTAAVQEHNEIMKSCIAQPEDRPPRFMIGIFGTLEVLSY